MKIMTVVAMAAVVGVSAQAKQVGESTGQQVNVYVNNDSVPLRALQNAEALAAHMFSSAGVQIRWHGRTPDGSHLPAGAIAITIASRTPEFFRPSALAFAFPYERAPITVFWDRVQHANGSVSTPVVLGHVLVHEITHVLQGIDRHSDSGVMKARWTAPDYEAMAQKPLPFTSEDVQLIHRASARAVLHGQLRVSETHSEL
jgi:hypothetical protein